MLKSTSHPLKIVRISMGTNRYSTNKGSLKLSKELAKFYYNSKNPFPIDLNLAWQYLRFWKKQDAKNFLMNNHFKEDVDYIIERPWGYDNSFGRKSEIIKISVSSFREMVVMIRDPDLFYIRDYFVEFDKMKNEELEKLRNDNRILKEKLVNFYL